MKTLTYSLFIICGVLWITLIILRIISIYLDSDQYYITLHVVSNYIAILLATFVLVLLFISRFLFSRNINRKELINFTIWLKDQHYSVRNSLDPSNTVDLYLKDKTK